MLRTIRNGEEHLIANDPVRPHIPFSKRVGAGRDIFVLEDSDDQVDAVICVRYTNEVPENELDLENFTDPKGNVAVFYTVWSYRKGAGREIVNQGIELLKKEAPWIDRYVTLSPLTDMARKFHISNGAKFVAKYADCQTFEYE